MEGIDPYKILDLPKNFTIDQLRENYKKVLAKYHSDNTSDVRSSPMFQIITGCYKLLAEEHKRKAVIPPAAMSSQQTFKQMHTEIVGQPPNNIKPKNNIVQPPSSSKFDLNHFNQMFDQHRISDVSDHGYANWMSDPTSFQAEDIRKKLSKNKDPQPINLAHNLVGKTGMDFYELGVMKVDDFSGDNMHSQYLNFTDYRVAHTVQKIVDPNDVPMRKEYKSIQELEVDRSQMPMTMSEKEQAEYLKQQKVDEYKEKKRLKALEKFDNTVTDNYQRTHHLFKKQDI